MTAEVCASCGAPLAGPYCAACGQATRPRVTARSLVRDALQGLTSLEQGFDRTVLDLLKRPGPMVRDYLRGRTRPYTSPLKFAIIAAAVAMVVMHLLDVLDAERYRLIGWDSGAAMNREIGAANELYLRFMNLFLLFMIPVSSFMTWALYRRDRLTFGEHVAFNAYVFGLATLLCTVLMIPLFFALGAEERARVGVAMLWMFASFAYFLAACGSFFGGRLARRLGLAVLAGSLAGALYFAATMGAMMGYAWMRTLG